MAATTNAASVPASGQKMPRGRVKPERLLAKAPTAVRSVVSVAAVVTMPRPLVSARRELLLDAAIRVLGERGVRAVTHRAVDAEAGVAAGSTANYFSTREALFEAIVERFSQRERASFDGVAAKVCPTSPAELGRALAAGARDSAGPNRTLTLSRYALLVESANNPGLREQMAATGGRVSAWFANWLRLIGSTDPDYHVHVVGNYLTGLVLHQLAIPDPHFDPTEKIVSLLESLSGTGPVSTPAAPAAGRATRHRRDRRT